MKRLVLLAEGDGDERASPVLVQKLLKDPGPWPPEVILDYHVIRIGGIERITGSRAAEWIRYVGIAAKRPNVGGILAILDGDHDGNTVEGNLYCTANVAKLLADRARAVGAGAGFSIGVVIARQEFESWFLAGIESLAGKSLPDGRPGVKAGATCSFDKLDENPRGAKRALSQLMEKGYKPSVDQSLLAQMLDVATVRRTGQRSFACLENAIARIIGGIRTGQHVVSPS